MSWSMTPRYVNPQAKIHQVCTTIQHWQLRDLVSCPRSPSEVYFVDGQSVGCLNTKTGCVSESLQLNYAPTSMTASSHYLATGGHDSELTVRDFIKNQVYNITIGGSINNCCVVSFHCNETRLLVANNEKAIKVFNLPSLDLVETILLPMPVNFCAVSPDGQKLAAVGDTNKVFLFDIRAQSYHPMDIRSTSNDFGLSCCWNQASDKFAVSSQDGVVCVFDWRSTRKPLCQLGAKRRNGFSTVKFSPKLSVDLLLFTEQDTNIHVVDARTFQESQILKVGTHNISGACFSPDCSRIFVGAEECLFEYEVELMSRRTFPAGCLV
eukprot:Lithocolla_globosa_v1_NODE_851_length_3187_cov_22.354406.p1 type:complete len:323 gc:universal NODE_851_length_3187_cov_22.354406:673-1641(+)